MDAMFSVERVAGLEVRVSDLGIENERLKAELVQVKAEYADYKKATEWVEFVRHNP